MYPVPEFRKITTPYGAVGSSWSGGKHRGVDFKAPLGAKVYAPWPGTVIGIGSWGPAYGNRSPVIDFDRLPDGSPGFWGVLAHLETVAVKVGQRVNAGEYLGTVGVRGNTTGPHLHFEIQTDKSWSGPEAGRAVDPRKWIDAVPLRRDGRVYEGSAVFGTQDSDSVFNLQVALKQGGWAPEIPLSGNFGSLTRAGLVAVQALKELLPTDMAGTVAALGLKWVPKPVVMGPEVVVPPVVVTPPPVVGKVTTFGGITVGTARMWEDYTDKATDFQTVPADGQWHKVQTPRALRPVPFSGREDHMLYSRVAFTFKALGGGAIVECKFERGDGDETAMDERHYQRGTKSVPFQQVHFESGKKGLAGSWWVRVGGGLKSVTLTSRYAKTYVLAVV